MSPETNEITPQKEESISSETKETNPQKKESSSAIDINEKTNTKEDAIDPTSNNTTTPSNPSSSEKQQQLDEEEEEEKWKPSLQFWIIAMTLMVATFVCGLENSIIVTPLPFIIRDLNAGANYVWIANIHFMTGAAILPILGQLANLFGRRHITLFVLILYTLGSGLCGGAKNTAMLLVGRGIQGAGGSGILLMNEMIVADLAPVKYRPTYIGMIMGFAGIGSMTGPVMGAAIVQYTTWRWIFWLNLPVCGLALVLVWIFLRVTWNRTASTLTKLSHLDWGGNLLIMSSTVSVTIAFAWGGPVHPWTSASVLVPLILGLLGLVGFFLYETLPFVSDPLLPLHILKSPTSIILFVNTFLSSSLLYYTYFFFPVYFQAVLAASPIRAAVLMLPVSLFCVPAIVLITSLLSMYGRYKWIHICGFALWTLGFGVLALLNVDSTLGTQICVQIPGGLAVGCLIGTLLPAFQGAAPEKDQAAATASVTWLRTVAYMWGVAIASVVFNSYMSRASHSISDPQVRDLLSNGSAFELATKQFVDSYGEPVRGQIREAFAKGFRVVMLVGIGFTGLGGVLAVFEKDIKLRTSIETEFGLEERGRTTEGVDLRGDVGREVATVP